MNKRFLFGQVDAACICGALLGGEGGKRRRACPWGEGGTNRQAVQQTPLRTRCLEPKHGGVTISLHSYRVLLRLTDSDSDRD